VNLDTQGFSGGRNNCSVRNYPPSPKKEKEKYF